MKSFTLIAIGQLAADPVKELHGDTHVVKFTLIGSDYIHQDKREVTSAVHFTAFGATADSVMRRRKGDQLIVDGHLESTKWTDRQTGEDRYGMNYLADDVKWGAPGKLTRADLAA